MMEVPLEMSLMENEDGSFKPLKPGEDAGEARVVRLIVEGPQGGSVAVPTGPVSLTYLASYEFLPVGFRGIIEWVKV